MSDSLQHSDTLDSASNSLPSPLLAPIAETGKAGLRDPTSYLENIWNGYFSDVSRVNQVDIAYYRPWKRRLGQIRMSFDSRTSCIGLNSLLQLSQIPEYILITTIAHELVHYTHGFGSPLPCLHPHPHAGHVVDRELERRGLGETLRQCNAWIDQHWFSFYEEMHEAGWPGLSKTVSQDDSL
ncbi:MAG TPA: hypothetical protein VFV38_45865 [Ktedonobacteraceae bacterium]|nr:hypothetical protein [Ktedonobacteraceae bacterium]